MADDSIYRMSASPRGICLIINNINFRDKPDMKRTGAEADVKRFQTIFTKLRFSVLVKTDLTQQQAVDTLFGVSRNSQLKNHDSVVVIVLSHGQSGGVVFTDSIILPFARIFNMFNNVNCPHMIGKPKLFFFSCCRGDRVDRGTAVADSTSVDVIPSLGDLMTCYATVEGHVSWRIPELGTWFGIALAESFQKNAHEKELTEILCDVSKIVKTMMTNAGEKQVIEWSYIGWDRKLYFNVKEPIGKVFNQEPAKQIFDKPAPAKSTPNSAWNQLFAAQPTIKTTTNISPVPVKLPVQMTKSVPKTIPKPMPIAMPKTNSNQTLSSLLSQPRITPQVNTNKPLDVRPKTSLFDDKKMSELLKSQDKRQSMPSTLTSSVVKPLTHPVGSMVVTKQRTVSSSSSPSSPTSLSSVTKTTIKKTITYTSRQTSSDRSLSCFNLSKVEHIDEGVYIDNGSIKIIGIKEVDLKKIFAEVGKKHKHFQELSIVNPNVGPIEKKTFGDVTFDNINIFNHKEGRLIKIHYKAFDTNQTKTLRLELHNYQGSSHPYNILEVINSFTEAKRIELRVPNMRLTINKPLVQSNLVQLTIKAGELILDNKVFAKLDKLEYLILSGCQLKTVPTKAFQFDRTSDKMLVINLSRNQLSGISFADGCWTTVRRPVRVDLSYNQIDFLKEKAFKLLLTVNDRNSLDLGYNLLRCDNSNNVWLANDVVKFRSQVLGALCANHKAKFLEHDFVNKKK